MPTRLNNPHLLYMGPGCSFYLLYMGSGSSFHLLYMGPGCSFSSATFDVYVLSIDLSYF